MKIQMVSKKLNYKATAELNQDDKTVTVLKGSTLYADIQYSISFRGAKTIANKRQGIVKNNILTEDTTFKSLSTAANFVSGRSSNGLIKWKTEDGKNVKESI